MIAGVCKAFGVTPDYALHRLSFANLTMLCATLPDSGATDKKTNKDTINGDDPQNKHKIRKLLNLN